MTQAHPAWCQAGPQPGRNSRCQCRGLCGPTKARRTAGSPSACYHGGRGTKGQGYRLVRPLESSKLRSRASLLHLPPSSPGQEQHAQEREGAATQGPAGTSRLRGKAACRDLGAWGSGQGSRPGQHRRSLHKAFVACGDSATRLRWLLPDARAALRPGARAGEELRRAQQGPGAASSEPQARLATPLVRGGKWPA